MSSRVLKKMGSLLTIIICKSFSLCIVENDQSSRIPLSNHDIVLLGDAVVHVLLEVWVLFKDILANTTSNRRFDLTFVGNRF